MKLSDRVLRIQPSLTLAVSAKAAKLRAQGVDVIAFGVGEPDFDTPQYIKDATIVAMAKGVGKYTAVSGTPELRRAAATEINSAHGTRLAAENVIVSVGAKHSLYNLFQAMLDDDDEVIVPSPCWVSYPEMVQIAGGKAVILPTAASAGYQIDGAALLAAVTPRTRAICINSPCNPTGAVYTAESMLAIGRVLDAHPHVFLITDDIYRRLVYGETQWQSLARLRPDLADRIIFIDGVSKSYAMTGWRIGFCGGPKALIQAMDTLQGQSTTNPSAIAQAAALAAITGPQATVEEMRVEFDRRRQRMVTLLRAIPGIELVEPEGAFYCFPDVTHYINREPDDGIPAITDDIQLAEWILTKGRVAVVPGSGFLAPGFLRLSYATSMAKIEAGVARMAEALAALCTKA